MLLEGDEEGLLLAQHEQQPGMFVKRAGWLANDAAQAHGEGDGRRIKSGALSIE